MDYETRRVIKEWDREVKAEMRRLIRAGIPPWDAAELARKAVTDRRRNANNSPDYRNGL